ncbi:Transcriptional activatory protein BadR [Burkholderiales bacterium]|nr:Transcriptional activatory protein BadR [Burkholderiales bacterium]
MNGVTLARLPARQDHESRLTDDHHDALRLWLRLLTCTTMIERGIRRRLRERYAMTLARFDLMAQLERAPSGLRMGELSRRLMVTGGNVTGLVAQLVDERLVERRPVANDRRAHVVRLSARGRAAFVAMAAEHERWIVELTGGLPAAERDRLHALLGRLKASVRAREPDPYRADGK